MGSEDRLEHQKLFDYLKMGQEITESIATNIADTKHNEFCADSDWNQISDQLEKTMKRFVDLEIQLNNSIKASDKTQVKIRQLVTESENSDNITMAAINTDELFDQNLAEIVAKDESTAEQNEKYRKLKNILKEINGIDDDEDLMELETRSEQIPIDPISKKPIEFAVKNKKCGHIYDREQLRQLLEARTSTARIRCPNVGCNNKSVTLNDVVDDPKTMALIRKLKQN